MGFALPAAIGAKFGAPERTVVAVIGDGGIQMTLQELGTIYSAYVENKTPDLTEPIPFSTYANKELLFSKTDEISKEKNQNLRSAFISTDEYFFVPKLKDCFYQNRFIGNCTIR